MNCFRAATVVGFIACLAPAAAGQQEARVDGTYCGSLYAGERLVDAVTKLESGANGEIRGTYKFMEQGRTISGGLLAITIGEDGKAEFRWIDKYGIGRLIVTFDFEHRAFTGLWSAGESEPEYPWFGQRCHDKAEPGQVT
jgi:hypothetical protein